MPPTTLLVIRHAQTDSNLAGPCPAMSGWTDTRPNAAGLAQIAQLRQRFAAEPPLDAIYSSPLTRAQLTASAVAGNARAAIRLLDDLREINCGELDGLCIEDVNRSHPELWEKNLRQDDNDFRWPGGESYRELRQRTRRVFESIAAANVGGRIAIVTHAGVISQILGSIHGLRPAQWESFRPENTSVTTLHWTDPNFELVRFDDHSHLQNLAAAAPRSNTHPPAG